MLGGALNYGRRNWSEKHLFLGVLQGMMQIVETGSSKKTLRVSPKLRELLRRAERLSLDVEELLGEALRVEAASASENDDEVVMRLCRLAEESEKLPDYPCRWFTENEAFLRD